MKKIFLLIIFFLTSFSIEANEDSIFVKVVLDTVQIWNTDVSANCASKFISSAAFSDSNIIIITECDTVGPLVRCTCNFDLNIALTGLSAGQYSVIVYRQELEIYLYPKDTTIFVGELNFTLGSSSAKSNSFRLIQSDCKFLLEQTFTAQHWYGEAKLVAESIHNDARIRNINSSDVSIYGESYVWNYKFSWYDQINDRLEYLYFHNEQDRVVFDSLSLESDCCVMHITEEWIDSDSAFVFAEAAGGEVFRDNNPDYFILASLYQALVPDSYPNWQVTYRSKSDSSKKSVIYFDARKNITELEPASSLPKDFRLEQNYPNPFNPATTIKYELPQESEVRLVVYNMLGEKAAELVNTIQKAGRYEVEWNAHNFASGVYFYSVKAFNPSDYKAGFFKLNKMVLAK